MRKCEVAIQMSEHEYDTSIEYSVDPTSKDDDNHKNLYLSYYADWQKEMSYQTGLGILYACGSEAAKSRFSSKAIFWGSHGVLVPGPFHSFAPSVAELVPPGVQGTNK